MLSNELTDLARLKLPIASLYERYKYNDFEERDISELPTASNPSKGGERYAGSFRPQPTGKKLNDADR